jgi:hypothetical protein
MNELVPPKFGMGAATRRLEDTPLITGHGRYPTDVMPEGALVGYVVRSAAGHARISVGDLDEARAAPGVHLVWTAADIGDLGTLPCLGMGEQKDGSPIDVPPYYLLCGDVVRRVGDGIAFIVADDLNAAKAAGDLIAVDYDLLPAAIGAVEALAADAPLVWPEKGSNVAFEYELGDAEASAAAFAAADKIARLRIINNRLVCNYMQSSGREDPGHHARCRRRFRHKGVRLSGIPAGGESRQNARPAGALGVRAQRAFPGRRARPRQYRRSGGRARWRWPHRRDEGRPDRQYGLLFIAVRAVHSLARPVDVNRRL